MEWQEFDHPQLGKIKIGGWNSIHTWRNPPPLLIENEISRHFPFVLALGNMLPWLSAQTVKVEPIGNDDFRLTVIVENNGFLPTFTSEQAKMRKAIRPVRAEIDLPKGASLLVNHKRKDQIGYLEGRSNKLSVNSTYASSPTDNRGKVEWVIHAPDKKDLKLKIVSERAGSLTLLVQLDKTL